MFKHFSANDPLLSLNNAWIQFTYFEKYSYTQAERPTMNIMINRYTGANRSYGNNQFYMETVFRKTN